MTPNLHRDFVAIPTTNIIVLRPKTDNPIYFFRGVIVGSAIGATIWAAIIAWFFLIVHVLK